MWKQGVVAAAAVALIVVAITLVQGVSASRSEPAPAVVKDVARAAATIPTMASAPRTVAMAEAKKPAPRGPASGVWAVMAKPHASPAAEREDLISAIRSAPACGEKWCEEGRNTLAAWQRAIEAKVPRGVEVATAECSSAGCFVKIVGETRAWREVSAALPDATAAAPWQGPTIQGGPDFQTRPGSVIALWAILPDVPDNSEQGEDR